MDNDTQQAQHAAHSRFWHDDGRMPRKPRLKDLQYRLNLIQQAYNRQGRRAIILLEGFDAAGKGGVIRRLAWCLDPRGLRVYPTGAPNAVQDRQFYLQRFWTRMPHASEFAVFDRSWYGRVLVERVEGLASEAEWCRAYDEINAFERYIVDNDCRLVKLFLRIAPETQLARFQERFDKPVKRWKLTEEDLRNRNQWESYERAVDDMLDQTSTGHCPWRVIDANHKKKARKACFRAIIETLEHGVDITPPPASPAIRRFFEAADKT